MFKTVGVHVLNDLKWKKHVKTIASKMGTCMYFLKQIMRAGASVSNLLYSRYLRICIPGVPSWSQGCTVKHMWIGAEMHTETAPAVIYQSYLTTAGTDTLKGRIQVPSRNTFSRVLHYHIICFQWKTDATIILSAASGIINPYTHCWHVQIHCRSNLYTILSKRLYTVIYTLFHETCTWLV